MKRIRRTTIIIIIIIIIIVVVIDVVIVVKATITREQTNRDNLITFSPNNIDLSYNKNTTVPMPG